MGRPADGANAFPVPRYEILFFPDIAHRVKLKEMSLHKPLITAHSAYYEFLLKRSQNGKIFTYGSTLRGMSDRMRRTGLLLNSTRQSKCNIEIIFFRFEVYVRAELDLSKCQGNLAYSQRYCGLGNIYHTSTIVCAV